MIDPKPAMQMARGENHYPGCADESIVNAGYIYRWLLSLTSGYAPGIFSTGAPIAWASSKQSLVAPSSTVAEFLGVGSGVKQGLWIKIC
jgi:hypothetical protein